MPFDRIVPFSALGVDGVERASFAVRLADREALACLLGGPVDAWQDKRVDGGEPARAGLFDERIFGPLRRDAEGRVRWERWAGIEPRERPQGTRFGRLDLPVPVVHPWLLRAATGPLAGELRDLALCRTLVRESGQLAAEDDTDALAGGEAVLARVRAGALALDESALLFRLPVLPAGLRPLIQQGPKWLTHDMTVLYELVRTRITRFTRLRELNAPSIILRNELHMLQRAVNALFLDGAVKRTDEDGSITFDPPDMEEDGDIEEGEDVAERDDVDIPSLGHMLMSQKGWVAAIDKLVAAEPRAFSKRWHSPPYWFRAWLEASALELVPVDSFGHVDEAAVAKSRVDRTARLFDDAYHEILGPLWRNVAHDSTGRDPHIDVYATEPQKDGTRLVLTAGMSAAAMFDSPRQGPCRDPHVELALLVPATLEGPLLEHLMLGLIAVARYPFLHRTHFAPGHDVSAGKPIAPGSALSAYVFAKPLTAEPFESLSVALPRSPKYLLALAISDAERARLMREQGAPAALARLFEKTRGVSDPGRASLD